MSALLELAERCEREQSSYGLNDEICKALAGPNGNYIGRDYSASLDAAMALVPMGCEVLDLKHDRDRGTCRVSLTVLRDLADYIGHASTPALALCAAALKARAASVDRNPEGEKPQALSAKHESAVTNEVRQTPSPHSTESEGE